MSWLGRAGGLAAVPIYRVPFSQVEMIVLAHAQRPRHPQLMSRLGRAGPSNWLAEISLRMRRSQSSTAHARLGRAEPSYWLP
jgi:hypothetical protein